MIRHDTYCTRCDIRLGCLDYCEVVGLWITPEDDMWCPSCYLESEADEDFRLPAPILCTTCSHERLELLTPANRYIAATGQLSWRTAFSGRDGRLYFNGGQHVRVNTANGANFCVIRPARTLMPTPESDTVVLKNGQLQCHCNHCGG